MRILLITYYFPPAGGGGVQRVLGWCRHLAELGDEVTVAAPREPRWVNEDTTLVIPARTELIRTSDPSPAAVIPRAALARERGLRRMVRRIALQPRRLAVPDIHRRWREPAVQAILAHAHEHDGSPWDVVVSSSPPETAHLVAHDVAEALGIPWIADYRDSWLDLPHLRMSSLLVRLKHRRNIRMATRLMGRAHAATTVSEPLASDLRGRHPGLLVEVIENGIELDQIRRAQQRADDFREVGRFVVAYTGNFFGMQRASEFLDGVEAALIAEPMMSDDLLIRFIGGLKPHEQKRAIGLGGIVEHTEFLRHDDVLAQQRAADLLLLYVAPGRGSQGVFTGKVFEYVAARRPVLALAPADNVASTLLGEARSTRTSGGALVTDFTAKSIADALIAAWQEWQRAGGPDGGRTADINVSEELLSSLDRSAGARRLADLVRRVVHA